MKGTIIFFTFLLIIGSLIFVGFFCESIDQELEYDVWKKEGYEIKTYGFNGVNLIFSKYSNTFNKDSISIIKTKDSVEASNFLKIKF